MIMTHFAKKAGLFQAVVFSLLFSGCNTLDIKSSSVKSEPKEQKKIEKIETVVTTTVDQPEVTLPPADIWERLRRSFSLAESDHPRVKKEIKRLQNSPEAFKALTKRAQPYLFYIAEEVEKNQLPAELVLLPAVESGFKPFAYSRDGAAGLWQFMPATGRMLGMTKDWWGEPRRSITDSTEAALAYLDTLNKQFDGDWLHTLAAYNAGNGRVSRSIKRAAKKNKPTDFWNLDLPRETDMYVPRLIALITVVKNPEQYGLELPAIPNEPYFEKVIVDGQIDLKIASDLIEEPVEDLIMLNPEHNRWATSPDESHELLIPIEKAADFKEALANLPEDKRIRWTQHKIKKGETLGHIANKHDVSVKAIQRTNKLKNHIIRTGKTLIIPLSDSVAVASMGKTIKLPRIRRNYTVRRGDSLYKIAKQFDVKIKDLKRWNSVGRYIKPGQNLTVYVKPYS
jgi:membrane-bound lytic murein transglycosylase D